MKKDEALFPGPRVPYVKHDAAGRILQSGQTHAADLALKKARGELVLQGAAAPNEHKVVDGKIRKLTKADRAARAAADAEAATALAAAAPVGERRAVAYPPLSEFADAFYWSANGDEGPMSAWLAAVAAVKAANPKG